MVRLLVPKLVTCRGSLLLSDPYDSCVELIYRLNSFRLVAWTRIDVKGSVGKSCRSMKFMIEVVMMGGRCVSITNESFMSISEKIGSNCRLNVPLKCQR